MQEYAAFLTVILINKLFRRHPHGNFAVMLKKVFCRRLENLKLFELPGRRGYEVEHTKIKVLKSLQEKASQKRELLYFITGHAIEKLVVCDRVPIINPLVSNVLLIYKGLQV